MSYFLVKKSGILTTIQDLGRFGYGDIGISQSGVVDEFAYNWSNKILNNPYGTNALEITYGNFEILSFGDTLFTVTGADCEVELNGKRIELWRAYRIKSGDRLKIGLLNKGVRSYLAVLGGFLDKKVLGSYSVSIKERIKGALRVGDKLKFRSLKSSSYSKLKDEYIPNYPNRLELRVVLGYEFSNFSNENLESFFSSSFYVKSHSRMGYILGGANLKINNYKEIVSNPIAFGAIQIPKSGEPIILLKERQTVGGYPKIGSLLPVDAFKLSQLKEGDKVSFKEISQSRAIEITREFNRFFMI